MSQSPLIQATADELNNFDVRDIPCRIKHGQIVQRWLDLPVGHFFVLVNDHEPIPLLYQFEAMFPAEFTWEPLERGPEVFRIKISRIAPAKNKQTEKPGLPSACQSAVGGIELDLRGMEPPGPMMQILNSVEAMPAGGTLRARTDRRPLHLLPELEARGILHSSENQSDGSWITTLTRP